MREYIHKLKYWYLIAKDYVFGLFNRDIELLLLDYVKFLLRVKRENNLSFLKELKQKLNDQNTFRFSAFKYNSFSTEDDKLDIKVTCDTDDPDIRSLFERYKGDMGNNIGKLLNDEPNLNEDAKEKLLKNADNFITNYLIKRVNSLIEDEENRELDDNLSNYVKTIKQEDTVLYDKDYVGETIIKLQVKSEFQEQLKKFPYHYKKYKADKFSKKFEI